MKLSVIVGTRNRAHRLSPVVLASIVRRLRGAAAPLDAEIVVVDNGSKIRLRPLSSNGRATALFPSSCSQNPKPAFRRAHNRALRVAQGEIFAFTDDDCRLSKDYVNDLLRHDAADTELVLRGGRIELGDPTDLPLTIKTTPDRIRWNRRTNSARHQPITGQINGCNMTMHRASSKTSAPSMSVLGRDRLSRQAATLIICSGLTLPVLRLSMSRHDRCTSPRQKDTGRRSQIARKVLDQQRRGICEAWLDTS